MSNGGIAIISGIQPFQPLVGSWRPAPQALSDGIGIGIISGKHTGTGLSAARGVVAAGFTGFVGWWNCHYPWPGMHTDSTLSAARGVVAAGSTGYVGWYRNCHYLWQAHRHRTFSRTWSHGAPASQNGLGIAIFFSGMDSNSALSAARGIVANVHKLRRWSLVAFY